MQTFFTTSTGPPFTCSFVDTSGATLSIAGATFTLTFRSITTKQKVRGSGSFNITNGAAGQVQYGIGSTDFATAYAVFSALPGRETFEVYVEATIGALVYDALPVSIEIRKI